MVHRARLAVVGVAVAGTFACGSPDTPDGLTDTGIRLDPIVEIGDRDGQGYIGRPVTLTQDSQGRIWIVSEESDHRISVFDPSGRFEREIGGKGEGPEEFQNINAVVAVPGDTIVAFDIRNRRRVAISADGDVVRAEPVDISVYSAQAEADGRMLVTLGGQPGLVGYPVQILPTGDIGGAFLGAEPPGMEYDFYDFHHVASWAGDGSVWLTPAFEYRLERWSATGEPLEQWSRDVEWMPPGQPWRAATPEIPPTPTIRILTVDDAGLIWTGITVGEPDWARALGEPHGNPEAPGQLWPIEDLDALFGTRIEVLDPERRIVLASIYVDEFFYTALPDGRWVSYRESDGGVPTLIVWTVAWEGQT
jgi:hypothetical protein